MDRLSVRIPRMLARITHEVLGGKPLNREDALYIASVSDDDVFDLLYSAHSIRKQFRGNSVDVCAIINAKSGACTENCSYCAQSANNSAERNPFPLLGKKTVLEKAEEARRGGAKRFCIVTSGRKASKKELAKIAEMITSIRAMGLLPCATLGLLNKDEIISLKVAGLERYHHNLETSERFFPSLCTTHTYQDRLNTIKETRRIGISLCSGGIFGVGETWLDRIALAFALKELDPDSVPLNFLIPIKGTKLEAQGYLNPLEALKIISLYRFILPEKEIRICGGRIQTLGEFNSFIFLAGADSILSGNYLTTTGRRFEDDARLMRLLGLTEK